LNRATEKEEGVAWACHLFYLQGSRVNRVARFFNVQYTKTEKIYPLIIIYPKATKYVPHSRKIDQMAIKCSNIFHCKTLQNLPELGFFGLKICHLATLCVNQKRESFFSLETKSRKKWTPVLSFTVATRLARFLLLHITKTGKNVQNEQKNVPSSHTIS
jgi:hypothetical protein